MCAMKTLFIYLVLVIWAGVCHAQEVTELKEAKVGFAPLASEVVRDGNNFTFNIKESYAGEFESNPLAFIETYFDINNFITEVRGEEYEGFQVTFKNKKGQFQAEFDKNGNLGSTSERFKNITLPANLREQLYRDHKGWVMLKNVRIARGQNGLVDKQLYRIKLKKGDQRKTLKIDGISAERSEVASN